MPIMVWEKSLDVGVESMNDDHREILDLMNKIYDMRTQVGPQITALVAKLGDVCVRHFADEEQFMQQIDFPDFAGHKQVHERLLTKYTEHAHRVHEAGGKVTDDFFDFLKFWLNSHIKGVDVKYGEHAARKHAKAMRAATGGFNRPSRLSGLSKACDRASARRMSIRTDP